MPGLNQAIPRQQFTELLSSKLGRPPAGWARSYPGSSLNEVLSSDSVAFLQVKGEIKVARTGAKVETSRAEVVGKGGEERGADHCQQSGWLAQASTGS